MWVFAYFILSIGYCVLVIYCYKKINKNQAKFGIKAYDYNVLKVHISRFVVEFIEEVYPILEIKENKKKRGGPSYLYVLC